MSRHAQRGFIDISGQKKGGDEPQFYDLRYFRWLVQSDAWDGTSLVSDGWVVRVLLYRGQFMYQEALKFQNGRQVTCETLGNASFIPLSHAGMAYIDIAGRVQHMLGIHELHDFSPLVLLDRSTHKVLRDHVQYKHLEAYCLERGKSLWLKYFDAEQYEVILK